MITVRCPNCKVEVQVNVERYDEDLDHQVSCIICNWLASLFCFDYVSGNKKEPEDGTDQLV
jgi:hypothetical protein